MSRLGIAIILSLLFAGILAMELDKRWKSALIIPNGGVHLLVAPGDNLRTVLDTLHDQGVVPYPLLARVYGRWSGLDTQMKRGEYLLPQYLTIESLLALLSQGSVIQHQVTFPEGITLKTALTVLAGQSKLKHLITSIDDPRIKELVAPISVAEGWFFPDTYTFERGATDWQILQRAFARMQSILAHEWAGRADNLPYESPYQALIMASIIERETGQPSERGEIAGVFVRRLQKKMRLQTDPSVIYGLGDNFDGNLRRSDLHDKSNPYNTYRHHGLPPSPIALPGRDAIHAALNPKEGGSLYFVAKGDGSHEFSASLKAHQIAVRKYQLKRRTNYRSSPEK